MTSPQSIFTESIDALAAAAADAREVIREAHGATKDLRQAITEARRLSSDLIEEIKQQVVPLGDVVMGQLNEAISAAIEARTAGQPLNIMCSRCGVVLAACATPGETLRCANCGHKFMLRHSVGEET